MIGRRFFLVWMLTFLSFPLGGLLALVVVGSVEGVASATVAGLLTGAVVGASQWFVLRGSLEVTAWWVPATALGLALGDGVGAALTSAGTSIGDLLVTGLASGIAVGVLQWTLLKEPARRGALWPVVVALAWPLGWTVTWTVGVDVERGYAVFGSTGALVFASVTGAALLLVRRSR